MCAYSYSMSARAEGLTAVVTVNSLSRGNPASQPKPGAVNVNGLWITAQAFAYVGGPENQDSWLPWL